MPVRGRDARRSCVYHRPTLWVDPSDCNQYGHVGATDCYQYRCTAANCYQYRCTAANRHQYRCTATNDGDQHYDPSCPDGHAHGNRSASHRDEHADAVIADSNRYACVRIDGDRNATHSGCDVDAG